MFGVILWSDPEVGKAVIWCEDHGDLAYYEDAEHSANLDRLFFDPGDYVEFDLCVDNELRRASNAHTILAAEYRSVAHTLNRVRAHTPHLPVAEEAATSAQVIHLTDHLRGSPQLA
ncbi:MAG: hypothetical protein AAF754_11125 [Pseudomonadota bacterium]